jgi:hypothetical protein
VNHDNLTMYRRLTQKNHFVSGRILKGNKTMGDNNVRLLKAGLVSEICLLSLRRELHSRKVILGQFISIDSGHIHLNMPLGICG